LVNALKFTLEAGKITVSVHRSRDDQGGVEIAVADSGVGMTREEIKVAITRFGRLRNTETLAVPGTGLGLPLSIDLTELHGGRLEIESEKGVGTTIIVHFPHERILETPPDELSVGG
jgi:signal transduction histidine kinase